MSDKATKNCWICEEVFKREKRGTGRCLVCGNRFCGSEHGLVKHAGEDYCLSCYLTLAEYKDIKPREYRSGAIYRAGIDC